MTETISTILQCVRDFLWNYILVFILLGTHLYLTFQLRAPQRHLCKALKCYFPKKGQSGGEISQFSALMVSLASNVGVGNITGVAVAVSMGGPGAIFWLIITGFLGMSTRYAESLLAIRYRVQDKDGNISGGPMYAIERGLNCKWLAVLFAVFTTIAAIGIGNLVQANTVAQTLASTVPPVVTGGVLALLVAGVLLFGLNGISRACSALVPTMAFMYLLGCGILLVVNFSFIGQAVCLIFEQAFSFSSVTGGLLGSTIVIAMREGSSRCLFATEAGLGSAPIVSAAVKTDNPVQQALVAYTAPFWTVLICTLTGVTLTTSFLAAGHTDASQFSMLDAFGTIGSIGSVLLTISLVAFAVSTLLGWSYYGEKSLEFLGGRKLISPYRAVWVVAVFVGCVIHESKIVWNFSDIANGLMAIPNLVCVIILSGVILKETRYYLKDNNLYKKDETPIPVIDKKN